MVYPVPPQSPTGYPRPDPIGPPIEWWQHLLTPPTYGIDRETGETYRRINEEQVEEALKGTIGTNIGGPMAGGLFDAVPAGALRAGGGRPGKLLREDPKALAYRPDVPQASFIRNPVSKKAGVGYYEPKQPETTKGLLDEPVQSYIREATERGREMGGTSWYNIDPLIEFASETLGSPELGREYGSRLANYIGATSPQSTVPKNIDRAFWAEFAERTGQDVSTMMPPKGLGTYTYRTSQRPMLERVSQGIALDPLSQQKASSFAANIGGNYAPYTIDIHNMRGWGLASGANVNRPRKGGPVEGGVFSGRDKPTAGEYPFIERAGRQAAMDLDMMPAEQQAAMWMGLSEKTGVSDPRIIMQVINDSIEASATAKGISPREALSNHLLGLDPLY